MAYEEFEHKFVVTEEFLEEVSFRRKLDLLSPERIVRQDVRDVYYISRKTPGFIYRHRYDKELQQLTVKSFGGDTERRTEINLELDQGRGDQGEAVREFLGIQGIEWQGTIHKKTEVFYLKDCEIACYEARRRGKTVRCVEFEARETSIALNAKKVLRYYENLFGFDEAEREKKSLVELMFEEVSGLI